MRLRVYREPHGLTIVVGPWACRYSWALRARFANGRRWSSGWHRWADDLGL